MEETRDEDPKSIKLHMTELLCFPFSVGVIEGKQRLLLSDLQLHLTTQHFCNTTLREMTTTQLSLADTQVHRHPTTDTQEHSHTHWMYILTYAALWLVRASSTSSSRTSKQPLSSSEATPSFWLATPSTTMFDCDWSPRYSLIRQQLMTDRRWGSNKIWTHR